MTLLDVPSEIYTTITIAFETSAAGLLSGTKLEIMPYFVPLLGWPKQSVILFVMRIVAILWVGGNTVVTLMKRKSFVDVFTW